MSCLFSLLGFVVDADVHRGLHGYTHEFVSGLSEKQQRDVLEKSIDVLTEFTGKKPKGWTAPAWSTSKETITLLEEFGIVGYSTADSSPISDAFFKEYE